MSRGKIRGEQIRDESVESVDIASGSIKAGELNAEAISGQTLITSTDATNDRLLIWDATDSALKKVAPGNLGLGGGGSVAGSNTQIQFNDGGSLAGATKLLYDKNSGRLKIGDTNAPQNVLDVYGNVSEDFVVVVQNDESTRGHVLKLATDGNGSGSTILEMEDGDNDVVFKARADGRFGFGPDGVSSMGAGTFVVGIDNSSHTADIAISQRLQHLGDSNTYLEFPADDRITLTAGGSTELEVDSSGVLVAEYIKHMGDTDTYIQFTDNDINIQAGSVNFIDITQGGTNEITFNEAGADVDFRVEGDNNTHLLYVDGGNDKVGIGTIPQTTLHVHADSINNGAVTISQSDNSGDASQLDLSKSRGTGASPTAVTNGDFIGQIRFLAHNGAEYANFADVFATAASNIDASDHGTSFTIRTSKIGTTGPSSALVIDGNQDATFSGAVYGKMRHITHHRYSDTSLSGKEWIPFAGSTAEQNDPSSISQGIAPYSGRLVSVLVRSSKSGGLGNTSVAFHTGVDGDQVISETATETVEANMSSANTSYTFNFTSVSNFAAGDIIGVSVDPTNIHGNVNVTCIWEYAVTA